MLIKQCLPHYLTVILFLIYTTDVYAAPRNFSGTYRGTENIQRFNCTNVVDNGQFRNLVSITISQNGNRFRATSNNNNDSAVTGTINESGFFVTTFNNNDGSSGNLNGSFTLRQLQFSQIGVTPSVNDGCLSNSTGTLNRVSNVIGSQAQTQQSRKIVRSTNSLISQHLATAVSTAFSFVPRISTPPSNRPSPSPDTFETPSTTPDDLTGIFENSTAASADKNNWSPDSFWGTSSFSEIHEDSNSVTNFDTDIYQFVGGFDKQFGEFFVGSAFTYAYAETEQTGQDSNSHVFGVTPYGAYQINDFMFISALAGYNYTYIQDDSTNTDVDVHDYTLETDLNFYKTFLNSIIVKTHLGVRFHHTYVGSTSSSEDRSTDELMWLGNFELGYQFQNKLTTHIGTYYEYFDREESANSEKAHDGVLYINGGFDYPLTTKLKLGAKVQADLTDEDTDIITGSISIRLDI